MFLFTICIKLQYNYEPIILVMAAVKRYVKKRDIKQ